MPLWSHQDDWVDLALFGKEYVFDVKPNTATSPAIAELDTGRAQQFNGAEDLCDELGV